MSAYIVSNKTIDCIVHGFQEAKFDLHTYTESNNFFSSKCIKFNKPDELGQALLNQNYASVNYRYQENETAPQYRYKPSFNPVNLKDLYGCICCFEYQACETPHWDESGICYSLNCLRGWITEQLIKKVYGEKSPWGLD